MSAAATPGETCRTCDAHAPECLTWADYDTPVGPVRVTQCQDCLDDGVAPKFTWVEAVHLTIVYPGDAS